MKGLLTYLDEAEHELVRQAAQSAGMSVRKWARHSLVDSAKSANGDAPETLYGLVRQLHARICENPGSGEAADAIAALVNMGLTKTQAREKVRSVDAEGLTAADIIAEALKG